MPSLNESLKEKLYKRQQAGLMRKLSTQRLPFDFFSNDYLGFARSQELFSAIETLHKKTGIQNGSTGSRLLGGNSLLLQETEKVLSELFRSEASLILNSGYTANLAVLSSIPQKGDTILYDSLAHASLKDGVRLSLATRHSFRHNDLADLEQKLKSSKGKKFIVIEAIYSMDGDESPLKEIVALARRHDAVVILDEAHSTGVRGPQGAGCSVEQDLHDMIDIRIYTFGKAMGVHGACVAGSETVIRYLINFARPFIYTTALSQHAVAAISCAFEQLAGRMILQQTLQSRIELYLTNVQHIGNRTASRSAIQTILIPGNENARNAAAALQQKGFDVRPILYPTVAEGTERLRICLHTYNTDEEIVSLTHALAALQ